MSARGRSAGTLYGNDCSLFSRELVRVADQRRRQIGSFESFESERGTTDTHEADPISHFKLRTSDYARMARRIAALGLPTLILMEGGYAIDALGANVAEFLGGF